MKRLILFLLLGLWSTQSLYLLATPSEGSTPEAVQQHTEPIITGVVQDEGGEPLMGVRVQVEGTSLGAFSDVDGRFTIRVSSYTPQVEVFSYIGI